jgi:hypothetical protein
MPNRSLRAVPALAALIAAVPFAALAAPKPFTGPAAGWDHNVAATPSAQAPRALETWKKKDGEYVTYLADGGLSYDETLAAVKKNIGDNGVKTSVDTDRQCAGHRAHEFEMTLGSTIVHQLIVDDAPGLTKITYARPEGTPPAPDATTALTAYCAPSQ